MEIIETIEDTFDEVKKTIGKDNLKYILIGVVAIFVIVILLKKDDKQKVTVVSGVASYPDVVTNADSVISTLQNSIQASQDEIMESLKNNQMENNDIYSNLNTVINENFTATNDYINEGFSKQEELANTHHTEVMDGMENLTNKIEESNETPIIVTKPYYETLGSVTVTKY